MRTLTQNGLVLIEMPGTNRDATGYIDIVFEEVFQYVVTSVSTKSLGLYKLST
jgi:hypothetical protein